MLSKPKNIFLTINPDYRGKISQYALLCVPVNIYYGCWLSFYEKNIDILYVLLNV